MTRLPIPCVVVLIGPANAGKTTWALSNFDSNQVVSSDALRGVVGESEEDQRASEDAFALLDEIVERRLRRGLTTVIDTTALNPERRGLYRAVAESHRMPCYAVAFDVPRKELEARNRGRQRPVPHRVLAAQIEAWREAHHALSDEGFAAVLEPGPVVLVPADQLRASELAARQAEDPMALRFDLLIPNFTWPGGPQDLCRRLTQLARDAERAGFEGIWLLDHFLQIPQAGRAWDEMLESYSTLGYLAGVTRAVRLGTLVTGITYRNPALVGKMVATLDVLSGGRAICGLGAAWFEREHTAYGWEFPPPAERFALLEDTLQLLPLMWGPGSPGFQGKVIAVPEAVCYPRPLQERVPILVGGSGERKTLRLVAEYADGCNLRGGPDEVAHKLEVLQFHCDDVGRDRSEIEITHLSRAVVASDRAALEGKVRSLTQAGRSTEKAMPALNAGTVEDHIGRFRALAEAGVQTAIVNFPSIAETGTLAEFAPVISAFT